jgi:predicted Zn-dependent protease
LQLSPGAALHANAPAANPLEHALMATRARILADPAVDTLRAALQEALATPDGATLSAKSLAAVYGGALAALKLREFASARLLLAKLGGAFIPEPLARRAVQLLGHEIGLAEPAGVSIAGAASIAMAIGGNPAKRPELLLSSAAHLASGQPRAVLDALQTWLAQYPSDAPAWDNLAQIYQALGQPLRALTAQAQASLAREDLSGALDRLKAGQAMVKSGAAIDHIEASIIDTRARTVESALREQALER